MADSHRLHRDQPCLDVHDGSNRKLKKEGTHSMSNADIDSGNGRTGAFAELMAIRAGQPLTQGR